MITRKFFLLTCIVFCFGSLASQQCGTDYMMGLVAKRDTAWARIEAEQNLQAEKFAKHPHARAAIYTIPVVFHIIHTGGKENISREQILDQLRVLNNDYNFKNWNKGAIRSQFVSRAADCQIQFKLATLDPNGQCTDGINRIYSPLGVEVDQSTEEIKSLISWNTSKYLNIWVVSSIKSTQVNTTILGYAYFPGMTPANNNGVVVRSDQIGTIGTAGTDSGRTLTHEVGHWLNLYHTFQGECTGSDGCADTPPVSEASINQNCPANGNSCSEASDQLDMWEDYMDYSNGKCMALFSTDQKSRMHANFIGSRAILVSGANLQVTGTTTISGAPLANFTSNQRVVCTGTPVTFYDVSCKGAVTARSWTFTGASTPSSTVVNPVVVYQTPGKYKVSLLVQNGSGSNTKAVDQYIEVLPATAATYPQVFENFENGDPSAKGIVSITPGKWVTTNTAAFAGNFSFMAPIKTTDAVGTTYSFVTPPVNLSKLSAATSSFTFYTSYAPRTTGISEILRISISTDCGFSFTQLLQRSGSGLQFSGATATPDFVPTKTSQWKILGINSFSALNFHTATSAIMKIDVISAQGNPVYIDNLNISQWPVGTKTFKQGNMEMRVYPNPAKEIMHLDLDLNKAGAGTAVLYDITGRKIMDIFNGIFTAGTNSMEITNPGCNAGSLFVVKITTEDGQISKAVTFAP